MKDKRCARMLRANRASQKSGRGFTPLERLSRLRGWSRCRYPTVGSNAPLRSLTGFTLIEVIVTMTILGFILVIIYQIFRLGLSSWEKGESAAEEYQKIRIVSQLLSQQVKSAFPYEVKTKKAEGNYLAFEG
jgi:prepilin-type N-terminal cleavage/methylation domain-containing protein